MDAIWKLLVNREFNTQGLTFLLSSKPEYTLEFLITFDCISNDLFCFRCQVIYFNSTILSIKQLNDAWKAHYHK